MLFTNGLLWLDHYLNKYETVRELQENKIGIFCFSFLINWPVMQF